MKKTCLWIGIIITLLLVGCEQQVGEDPVVENSSVPVEEIGPTAEIAPADEPTEPGESTEDLAGPEVFVPITVEDFGLTTVVPADWPQIEGDPLLKNAWGPGEFRFVAFHSVPGEDVPSAMAQLLGISLEELLENPPEGDYWEERNGSYNWAMYAVDNPDIGLSQSVSMTEQDGTIYIVSLFVEMDYKEAVLNMVLENFHISSEPALDEVEVTEEESVEAEETPEAEETAEVVDVLEIDLLETNWMLARLGDVNGQMQELLPGVEITAVFKADGRVTGSAGCNDFASNYTQIEDTITISVPAMTRKTCDDPEGVMLQETSFLSNLTTVSSYQIEGDELHLSDTDGNLVLVFSSP